MKNPIIQEVREARQALAAKFDFDLHRICEDAMKRQAATTSVDRSKLPTKRTEKKGAKNLEFDGLSRPVTLSSCPSSPH